jgi:hypothetical protein
MSTVTHPAASASSEEARLAIQIIIDERSRELGLSAHRACLRHSRLRRRRLSARRFSAATWIAICRSRTPRPASDG